MLNDASPGSRNHSVRLKVVVEKSLQIVRLLEPVWSVQSDGNIPLPQSAVPAHQAKTQVERSHRDVNSPETNWDFTGALLIQ